MPTTVTGTSGTSYHLWQLPELSSPEPTDTKTFTTLTNDLSDGSRTSVLFGSNVGLRSWKLKLPTLAGTGVGIPYVTDINGASVPREQYLRSLFDENVVTGTPFAYRDPHSGQYYLVDFADQSLSMERFKYVAAYGTGIELRQRRIEGESIFDPLLLPVTTVGEWDNDHAATQWRMGNGTTNWGSMVPTGDVVFSSNPQNGLNTIRFNASADTGYLLQGVVGVTAYDTAYDIFLVMKMRQATFSNAAGILSEVPTALAPGGNAILVGSSGTALFANLALTNFQYRLNDVLYAQTAQAAPMSDFGIVHLRFSSGHVLADRLQIGKDRDTAGTYAKMDLAEMIVTSTLLPRYLVREVVEYLQVKWAIT